MNFTMTDKIKQHASITCCINFRKSVIKNVKMFHQVHCLGQTGFLHGVSRPVKYQFKIMSVQGEQTPEKYGTNLPTYPYGLL